MTQICYEKLKEIFANHCHGVPMQSLQHCMHRIAERHLLSHNDLLPLRAIHDCYQPEELLQLLEKWALLSPSKIEILKQFYDSLQDYDASIHDSIEHYQQSICNTRTCPCLSLPSLSQQQQFLPRPSSSRNEYSDSHVRPQLPEYYSKIVDYLSEELGRRWLDVGRRLPGMRNFVRDLQDDAKLNTKTKIITMLEELYGSTGSSATTVLLEALSACRLNRLCDELLCLLPS
ncbi:uncharacterized protein LOC108673583 [Hyalella azteca]|uniref:Uncharacterized protein LOC108673583 n=1 Tax=Hyalella azteca TaxID=294128 RepID=A0A8B7NT50_HYAAZ|nr:uncharacterized protein LOC108673583 [Hyalella azteca]